MASIPDGLRDLLIDYERQIASIEPLPYEASASTRAVGEKKIEAARWGQSFPYNKYCPGNCPTGCVATATAIIMRHYGYPATGRGSNSYTCSYTGTTLSANFSKSKYDWKSMPMDDGTNSHDQAYDGVARLMSDIGIAVGMDYHPEGSSASTQTARLALTTILDIRQRLNTCMQRDSLQMSGSKSWKQRLTMTAWCFIQPQRQMARAMPLS